MAWQNTTPAANEQVLVREERYWQAEGFHAFEMSNGISTWTNYENAVFRIREKITEYRGLTQTQAIATAKSFSAAPTFAALMANGSSVFESHSKRATVARANECGGYTVVCTEKWTALYVNGGYVRGAALADVE